MDLVLPWIKEEQLEQKAMQVVIFGEDSWHLYFKESNVLNTSSW